MDDIEEWLGADVVRILYLDFILSLFLPSRSMSISCNTINLFGFLNFMCVLGNRTIILTQSAVKLALHLFSYHLLLFNQEKSFIAIGSRVVRLSVIWLVCVH